MRRDGIGNVTIRHGGIDMAGDVKANEIVPVPGEAPAAQTMLEAVHVCGSPFLPEGPFERETPPMRQKYYTKDTDPYKVSN